MDKLSMFQGHLNKFYKRIASGNKTGIDRRDRIAKKELTSAKTATVEAEAPPDDCLPLAEYTSLHGDPNAPENKKRGHYVVELGGGLLAVGMPVVRQKGEPWKIRRKFANTLARVDTLEDGNSEGLADDDQADKRYEAGVQAMQSEYAQATSGMSLADLMKE
eukprot:9477798-Pyramimonas_sp.AAC.1